MRMMPTVSILSLLESPFSRKIQIEIQIIFRDRSTKNMVCTMLYEAVTVRKMHGRLMWYTLQSTRSVDSGVSKSDLYAVSVGMSFGIRVV